MMGIVEKAILNPCPGVDITLDVLDPRQKGILEVLQGSRVFARLWRAVLASDLDEVLEGGGPFTLLAPDNRAFDRMLLNAGESVLKNKLSLTEILNYHVLLDRASVEDLVNMEYAKTLCGQMLTISVQRGFVWLDRAKLIKADITCANGTIHVIDSLLLPDSIEIWKNE